MTETNDRTTETPHEAGTDQAKEKAKRQAADAPPENSKPDEGTRPDQLTSENDGGSQG